MVMCSDPVMRAPRRGLPAAYSSRIAISAGISDSAMAISLRPQSASFRSATRKSLDLAFITAAFIFPVSRKQKRSHRFQCERR
jgi:hypothetical protein